MKEVAAVIGGEGNGGVMLPDIHIGRDAPVAAALLLQQLALATGPTGQPLSLSQYVKTLPQWAIIKLKVRARSDTRQLASDILTRGRCQSKDSATSVYPR